MLQSFTQFGNNFCFSLLSCFCLGTTNQALLQVLKINLMTNFNTGKKIEATYSFRSRVPRQTAYFAEKKLFCMYTIIHKFAFSPTGITVPVEQTTRITIFTKFKTTHCSIPKHSTAHPVLMQ